MDRRYEALLRRLAVLDERVVVATIPDHSGGEGGDGLLDKRTAALVRLAGVVALQSSPQTYEWLVSAALAAGSSEEEVVGVLDALVPVIGLTRVSNAAVNVAAAIDCHLDLELLD